MARSVALGAREIEDDLFGAVVLRVEFAVDGGEGVEKLIGNVGEDGGTPRSEAALGDQGEEAGEKLVDGDGASNSESPDSRSAERSSESMGEGRRS